MRYESGHQTIYTEPVEVLNTKQRNEQQRNPLETTF